MRHFPEVLMPSTPQQAGVDWDKEIFQRSCSKAVLHLQSTLQVSLPVFLKRVWMAFDQPKFNMRLLIFHSQRWSFHNRGLRGRCFSGGQVCPCVQSSLHPLLQITGDGFLINAPLTGGTVTHRNLAFQSLLSPQPLSQSTGFKGNVTLAYLLTANGGGAGLHSTQTVKSNINLVQTLYNCRLAWE